MSKIKRFVTLCLAVGLGLDSGSGSISGSWHCPLMISLGGKQGGCIPVVGKKIRIVAM